MRPTSELLEKLAMRLEAAAKGKKYDAALNWFLNVYNELDDEDPVESLAQAVGDKALAQHLMQAHNTMPKQDFVDFHRISFGDENTRKHLDKWFKTFKA